jgi:hypothetical protein
MWEDPSGMYDEPSPIWTITNHMLAISQVCTLRSDLSCLPRKNFKRTTNPLGERYYVLECDLRLTILDEVSASRLLLLAYWQQA